LVLAVFARLPVDARARCKLVCRGWRNTLTDVSAWMRLDLSPSSGVAVRVTDAVLSGASGLARGALTVLDLSGVAAVTHDALLAVADANAGALTELRVHKEGAGLALLSCRDTEALLRAAPLLRTLDADGRVTATEALRMLRNEALFGPLRVRRLEVYFLRGEEAVTFAEATAAIAAHASLSSVHLTTARLDVPGALDAFVDAALIRRLSAVTLSACRLSPASAPALARLLGGSALTELSINNGGMQLLDAPAGALLADALRASSTLTQLDLHYTKLYADPAAVVALLGALTGHASLRCLELYHAHKPTEQAVALVGPALGALVAANTPALQDLFLFSCHLGDADMRPLLEALPHNTHLQVLVCVGSGMSAAFARDVLLPAVRANTSLLVLNAGAVTEAAVEAKALVAACGRARIAR
jgi:hypothetical protein